MKCHQEILASTRENAPETAPNLTLIHGWGADNSVWKPWARKYLTPYFKVYLIELPGFGQSPLISEPQHLQQDWIHALINSLPEHTHLLGWSLGGLLAQQITLQYPERIQSLTCLASTPRFKQMQGWTTAVSPRLFADFIKALGIEYHSVLKQFWKLQLQGSDQARPLIKRLTQHMKTRKTPTFKALKQGLELLRDIDTREQLGQISCPTLWLLGEHDPLIPAGLMAELEHLQPQAQTHMVLGSSHMPFFSHPEETAQVLIHFITESTAK